MGGIAIVRDISVICAAVMPAADSMQMPGCIASRVAQGAGREAGTQAHVPCKQAMQARRELTLPSHHRKQGVLQRQAGLLRQAAAAAAAARVGHGWQA